MAAKKDKMIPSEKERKRALKYATPAGTGRMWVTMGIAFIIFGIILLLIPIGLVISEASAQRYDPESIHTATEAFENHHFRYPGRIWRYLVYRKPEAPGHDSARISRRVRCEKISKLCWKASGI